MEIRFLFFLSFWVISQPVFSQFSTDFSEGNLDLWEGDKDNFIINASEQLQLKAPEGSTASWLYTPVSFTDSMVWELYISLLFAPSTSNQLKVFLAVNSFDPDTASGYYLEIGATGDQDPLELKYLNQGFEESLATSDPGLVGMDPVELIIRVIKKENGDWQVYRINDNTPELLITANHNVFPLSAFSLFGFDCKYTSTRRDKFYFDDISILPLMADTTSPQCLSLTVENANSVTLTFDELLDENSALSSANYMLSPGNLQPDVVQISQPHVILSWDDDFISQQEYALRVEGVMDQSGNAIIPVVKNFSYTAIDEAQPYELLITEIMADPTPAIGLPEAEYLEIYNSGNGVFRLSDYMLQVGSSIRALPDSLMYSGEYIILCDEDYTSQFDGFGKTLGIAGFPGLTNSGTSVKILNNADEIIHEVNYTSSWYGDAAKSNGGWSLEMKNPMHICSDSDNWSASVSLAGGTPGEINSTWENTADLEGPELVSVYTSSPQSVLLRFNESLDPILMENPSAYGIDPVLDITSAILTDAKTVELSFGAPMEEGTAYSLLPFDAFDCLGNASLVSYSSSFGISATILPGDVLINEILFNPATGGSRFIEVINVSENFVDLSKLAIGRISSTHNDIYPTETNEILSPGELAVFTPDPDDIKARYTVPNPDLIFQSSLPSWDATTDNASLISEGQIIDSFTYYSSWHLPVIADQNGVSLERISTNSPSSQSSTWHSASSVSGNATPTGTNSQEADLENEDETPYSIINSVFSPDSDGFKDFLALNFLLETGDYIGSVWVIDLEGREIIQLLSNESLGTSTIVQWDGRDDDQLLADAGIYVLFIQLWDAFGNVNEYKETCALVKR